MKGFKALCLSVLAVLVLGSEVVAQYIPSGADRPVWYTATAAEGGNEAIVYEVFVYNANRDFSVVLDSALLARRLFDIFRMDSVPTIFHGGFEVNEHATIVDYSFGVSFTYRGRDYDIGNCSLSVIVERQRYQRNDPTDGGLDEWVAVPVARESVSFEGCVGDGGFLRSQPLWNRGVVDVESEGIIAVPFRR